jgi:hypothetical protein
VMATLVERVNRNSAKASVPAADPDGPASEDLGPSSDA